MINYRETIGSEYNVAPSRHAANKKRNRSESTAPVTSEMVEVEVVEIKVIEVADRVDRPLMFSETRAAATPFSDLQLKFEEHVMCNFTPRHPSQLPKSQWVIYRRLYRLFEPHAPLMDVWLMGPGNLKQLITAWYTGHPLFAGLDDSAWCKRLKNSDPHDENGVYVFKFCFEHTPNGASVDS